MYLEAVRRKVNKLLAAAEAGADSSRAGKTGSRQTEKETHLTKWITAFAFLLLLSGLARADSVDTTWDFSFFTVDAFTGQPNGIASASMTFVTLPEDESPVQGTLEIISMQGEFNGEPVGWADSIFNDISAEALSPQGPDAFYNGDESIEFFGDAGGCTIYSPDGIGAPIPGIYLACGSLPPDD